MNPQEFFSGQEVVRALMSVFLLGDLEVWGRIHLSIGMRFSC